MRSSAGKSRTLTSTVSKGAFSRSQVREYSSKAADFDDAVGLPEMSRISAIENNGIKRRPKTVVVRVRVRWAGLVYRSIRPLPGNAETRLERGRPQSS